jgi:RNA polymerase sigma-70 factor (ECF subfamily)
MVMVATPGEDAVMGPRDDADLARRAARGDDEAFGELCRRHAPALLGMARGTGLTDADASDVVQEALCRVLEKRHVLAGVTKVRAWLYQVALNLARSRARAVTRQARILGDRGHDVPAPAPWQEPGDAPPTYAVVREAMGGLSPKQRDVVALRVAGLSFAEVALALGTSQNACKVHFHNAVKRLRQHVEAGHGA